MNNYTYLKSFDKSRQGLIGASEICQAIPHPDFPSTSVAGYGKTAITLYMEKTGQKPRDAAGFSAEMGHFLEPKILYEFIKDTTGLSCANKFYESYQLCELKRVAEPEADCEPYQNTGYQHHTEISSDYGVAHADCVYDPRKKAADEKIPEHFETIKVNGEEPFLLEAKSAQYWATKRKEDRFSGYDFEVSGWEGIPLKHYFQLQYQMALYGVNVGYLVLIFNTSEKHYWRVEANSKHQDKLIDMATKLRKAILTKTPPTELAMTVADVRAMYPAIKDDFCLLTGDDLSKAVELAARHSKAVADLKTAEEKKRQAEDEIALLLRDNKELRGVLNGETVTIAKWRAFGGGERVKSLSSIKAENPEIYKYLVRKDVIVQGSKSERPEFKLKEFA